MRALMALGILLVLLAGCGEEDYGGTFSDNEVRYLRELDKAGDLPDVENAAFDATDLGNELCQDIIIPTFIERDLSALDVDADYDHYFTKAAPAYKAAEKYLCPHD